MRMSSLIKDLSQLAKFNSAGLRDRRERRLFTAISAVQLLESRALLSAIRSIAEFEAVSLGEMMTPRAAQFQSALM